MEGHEMDKLRYFLKDSIRKTIDFTQTDQNLGYPMPAPVKEIPQDTDLISLPAPETRVGKDITVAAAIRQRHSVRKFRNQSLSMEELSYLLWCTQGIRQTVGEHSLRTVPSAGNRHALETYLAVMHVDTLAPGIYRYLPLQHALAHIASPDRLTQNLTRAALRQTFVAQGAVTFIWTAIPYRMEWRYGAAAHKVIALDAGHVCQNLYLACEDIGCGTCAVAAYDQEAANLLIGVDGQDEFVIYMAPLGKK
jgi:SagB-type dehydrogenase family enzyme